MKTVAFVCLMSLSLCLSQPTSLPDTHPAQQQAVAPKIEEKTVVTPPKVEEKSLDGTKYNTTIISIVSTSEAPNAAHPTQAGSATAPTTETKASTDAKAQENKVEPGKKEEAPKPTESKATEPTKTDVKPEGKDKPADDSKPSEKDKKMEGSTEKAVTAKSSDTPKDTTEKPMLQTRAFDGPSFIGGIILTLGLLAIGFMGFKYYKNQTERNYHTL